MDHHAYLVLGNGNFLLSFLDIHDIKPEGNPDVITLEGAVFSIEDARDLKERSLTKGFSKKKVFILKYGKFTPEAQNALLKTLEEPISNTHFIIFGRGEDMFLPTILSRVQVVREGYGDLSLSDSDSNNSPEKFLKMNLKKRLDFAKDFADEAGREELSNFLDGLLNYLRTNKYKNDALKKVFALRMYSDDPAALPRLILEHLAVVL